MTQTAARAVPEQGTHHYVLVVQRMQGSGIATGQWLGTLDPGNATRQDILNSLIARFPERDPALRGGFVLFFSLEINQL